MKPLHLFLFLFSIGCVIIHLISLQDSKQMKVYTQSGNPNCKYSIEYMKAHSIKFKECNITDNETYKKEIMEKIANHYYNGKTISMPIFEINGKFYYNIDSLDFFLNNLETKANQD